MVTMKSMLFAQMVAIRSPGFAPFFEQHIGAAVRFVVELAEGDGARWGDHRCLVAEAARRTPHQVAESHAPDTLGHERRGLKAQADG